MKILSEPIDAIVTFKAEGNNKPRPYKFRYRDRDSNTYEVKIEKIFHVEEWKFAGVKSIVYRCSSMICGVEKLYEIRYIIEECRWELYKM